MQAPSDPWSSSAEAPSRGGRGRRPRGRGRGRGPRGSAPRPAPTAPVTSQEPPAQPKPQEAESAPVRGRSERGRPFRGRGGRPISSGEIVKTDPAFVQTGDLTPEDRGLNLKLVVCGAPVLIKHLRYGNGNEEKEWSVEAGDATGTINVRIINPAVADRLADGVAIVIRNAFVEMVERKHMRLATDLFGKVEVSDVPHSFVLDQRTKHSETEYEKQ